ncbi:MAG: hypothetical protein M3Y22_15055, partial [Pseudomonadota bacterium]|nr:hypothetical protein [Pseudomonadota bacterium]
MRHRSIAVLSLSSVAALAGCGSSSISVPAATVEPAVSIGGTAQSGQHALAGAHVYLFATATSGYGHPSTSLLSGTATGSADNIGAYVVTDASGKFNISGGFTCTSATQVYLYVLGGDAGAGVNLGTGLLAALGNCPTAGAAPAVTVNEVSTVVAAYALA